MSESLQVDELLLKFYKICSMTSKHMSKVGIGFVIPSIAFQKITEVFPLEEQGGSNPLASTVQTPAHHMEGETVITQDSVDAETGEVLA